MYEILMACYMVMFAVIFMISGFMFSAVDNFIFNEQLGNKFKR